MKSRLLPLLVALLAVLAAVAAGCGESGSSGGTTQSGSSTDTGASATADPCATANLELVSAGKLTVGTSNPSFPPWFIGSGAGDSFDPTKGTTQKGYEAAVSYAVAKQLGFSVEEVQFTAVPFEKSYAPGPKDFDFDINQVSYTPKRAEAVDLSDSYYDVSQAVVARKDSSIAGATSIADLKDAKLGAPLGTTSYDYVVQNVKPSQKPAVYNSLADTVAALKAGQVDGIVVDLPTAFYVTAVQVPGATIVGQFPPVGQQEYFSLVLAKDSPLTPCVNQALSSLRDDGTLDSLQRKWLSNKASAPILR